jgi:hypothetical protein
MSDGNDTFITRNFLARHGIDLINQGYTVVPIQPGKKAPGFDGWQKAKASSDQVREWLKDGFKNAGVGILTKFTCAIDIDCMDKATAEHFEAFCIEHIGEAPVRIGRAPKRLLLYRTTEPFRKRRSAVYVDEWEEKQLIEVLGDGQQFVAYHIHPDTGRPYEWITDKSPLNTRSTDLKEIRPEQIESLLTEFERHAKAQGWSVLKTSRHAPGGNVDNDNPWLEDSQAIDISTDELRQRLMLIPVDGGGYDQWMQIGMALHHQFDGGDEGFDLWNEWSETSMDYDLDELQRKWPTFEIDGKKRAPLTARFILRLAKETVEKTALELSVKLRDAFVNAKDLVEWEKARQMAREAEIDGLARSALAAVAKDRRDAITGTKTSLVEIKKAISYMPKKLDEVPSWCQRWVYDVSEDRFFHLDRKISTTKQGFDAMYDRKALTKKDILDGKTSPTMTASALALNLFQIPTVDGRRYMPGRDAIFHEPDGTFCNTYPENEAPEKPEKILPRDKKNIDRVRAHIAHLLPRANEQRMLLDWLSWVVQNPGKHVNYAVLLQGVEGDGKSFFGELLRAVMGVTNVSMANANTIVKSDFTGWATGQCVLCVEEIRLASTRGLDKWDAINRIKPFITNNHIEVHPKGKDSYNVANTTSYMFFTNFKDAMPLDDNSRRYLVLFSQWQRKEDLKAFRDENPTYYKHLYNAIVESPGALRQWLLDHEQDESFDAEGNAPETQALKVMVRKSKVEFIQVLDDIISEDKTLEASRHLVDVTGLVDIMVAQGVEWPGPKALGSMLERDGYEALGKIRLPDAGVHRFYSKNPDLFMSHHENGGMQVDTTKVRAYLKARMQALGTDDL